jgi:hypothetical protein
VRFETPAGEQAQVDFARFEVEFVDGLGVRRIIRLSMVLGYPRLIRALRCPSGSANSSCCHTAALEAIGGVPREIRYDRMKAAVLGEDVEGLVVYNRARRSRSPLRLLAARLPALSGSSGRSDKSARTSSSARRPQRSAPPLAAYGRQSSGACPTRRLVNEAFAQEKVSLQAAFFSAGSEASSNGSQYACRRVDDGYGLLSLALPQWIFCTLIG